MDDSRHLKERLYARAVDRPDEVAFAAQARLGHAPESDEWPDFLDFFATSWVDAEGRTEVERAIRDGRAAPEALRWPREVRESLWVVDGWADGRLALRDVGTDATIAVRADPLDRRTVLRARILPDGGDRVFSGEPDIYDPMGVIARMDLWQGWIATGEFLDRLCATRLAFLRQREEREAFVDLFGADWFVSEGPDDLASRLERLCEHVLYHHRPVAAGLTRAEAWEAAHGEPPKRIHYTPGATLAGPGRHGVIYDDIDGVHFLPRLGELWAHLGGEAQHADVLDAYRADPELARLPFARAGAAPAPSSGRRAVPSVLPGFDD